MAQAQCFFCKQVADPQAHQCWAAPKDPRGFEFWADDAQFFTLHPSMSVAALKHLVDAGMNRTCHQEYPARAVLGDTQSVDLTVCPRFLFVPPASY
jgi:hypothetical protein